MIPLPPPDSYETCRLGVLLSGGGRTLTNLLSWIRAGKLNAQVACVVASRECKGLDLGIQADVPSHLVPYREIPDPDDYGRRIQSLLDQAEVDLVCMAGFLSKWPIPDNYAGRVVNIHPALLPMFGGKGMYGHHVHRAVLASGCKVSGATVHYVNNEYDSGPIIAQSCVPVEETDDADALAARVFQAECELFPRGIALHAAGRLKIEGSVVRVSNPG
jgi:formyltetrahydrofolate-dependent phosphoribosylglycinamide formyltransferase